MASIKESSIQEVRLRARIEDVVSQFVQLKRAGSQMKGLCPFHREKTPSFHVSPDRGYYKCFGCGKAGDVFRFLMDMENRDFPEAIEVLARRYNVNLEYDEGRGPSAAERSLRQQLHDLHETATGWFRERFQADDAVGKYARDYWENTRRLPASLADEFRIGFAPPEDFALAAFLIKRRVPDEALRNCGIFYEREGHLGPQRWRCRFRGRLMIPIRDVQDRVVAFTARKTDLTPTDEPSSESKYINSPETEIFRKSNLLFNLSRARPNVKDDVPFLLVEGQLDALRCWQAGLRTAVAPQGTAITEQQLQLLRRYSSRVECFLDGDSAGQKAALRMLPLALRAGLEVTFLPLAPGDDPDSYFRERDASALGELRKKALPALEFACRRVLPEGAGAGAEAKDRAAKTLFEIIAAAESDVLQAACLRTVAGHIGLSPSSLHQSFQTFLAKRPRRTAEAAGDAVLAALDGDQAPAASTAAPGEPQRPSAPAPLQAGGDVGHVGRPEEDYILALVAQTPALLAPLARVLPIEWIDTRHTGGSLLDRVMNEVQHGMWTDDDTIDRLLESDAEREFAARLLFDVPKSEHPHEALNRQLAVLCQRRLQSEVDSVSQKIARTPPENTEALKLLFLKKKQLLANLRNPPTVDCFS